MKTAIIAVVGCVAALAIFAVVSDKTPVTFYQQQNWATEQSFMRFIAEYGRVYGSKAEYEMRLAAFERNMNQATLMNSANSDEVHGITEFADYTEEEFSVLLGLLPIEENEELEYAEFTHEPLQAVDWVSQGVVAPVKNQGGCGSCWAFSAIGAFESRNAIKTGKKSAVPEWSEQQLVDCSRGEGNMGCRGGWMHWAFKHTSKVAEASEKAYPYHAKDETCKEADHAKDPVLLKSKSYKMVATNETALKQALTQGPVSVAVDAGRWSTYREGVFSNCGTQLNHGVLAVGYTNDYWTIKNSWGNRWGEKGFMRIKMGNTCGILNKNSFPEF